MFLEDLKRPPPVAVGILVSLNEVLKTIRRIYRSSHKYLWTLSPAMSTGGLQFECATTTFASMREMKKMSKSRSGRNHPWQVLLFSRVT